MNVNVEVSSLNERNAGVIANREGRRKRGACYQSDAVCESEEEDRNETSSRHYRQQ